MAITPRQNTTLSNAESAVIAAISDDIPWSTALDELEKTDAELPPIDPDAGRTSGAELRLLAKVLGADVDVPHMPTPSTIRGGYGLASEVATTQAVVVPCLALHIAGEDHRRDDLDDVWAVDDSVARILNDPTSAALVWLRSPGRRLVHDLNTLLALRGQPPADWSPGATDLGQKAVLAAAGISADERDRRRSNPWRELHAAVPGAPLQEWSPAPATVPRALQLLEQGSPAFTQAGALAWLLDRAATDPFYAVQGIQRDLRQDLPVRLAVALRAPSTPSGNLQVGVALEVALLHHAAAIGAGWTTPATVSQIWGLARWLHGSLTRSPFFGGDEEALLARVRALLPPTATGPDGSLDASLDPLHPSRLATPGVVSAHPNGMDLADLVLVAGAVRHYRRADGAVLLPTPLPLVSALQRIAGKLLSSGDTAAETSQADLRSQERVDELGWSQFSEHIAPPLVARWLLTQELKASWLASASQNVLLECLALLHTSAERHAWLAFAWQREGSLLEHPIQNEALTTWRKISRGELPPQAAAAMAAGLGHVLEQDDVDHAIDLVDKCSAGWRAYLLSALMQAVESSHEPTFWSDVATALYSLSASDSADDNVRLNAALHLVRRVSARPQTSASTALLSEVAELMQRAPFNQHAGLRREVRRLGLGLSLVTERRA